jgi:hypothetical protein
MYTCKITTIATIATIITLTSLVSCITQPNKGSQGIQPKPKSITVNQTDIIKTDFPKVDYAN